jgi:hypothetical protein
MLQSPAPVSVAPRTDQSRFKVVQPFVVLTASFRACLVCLQGVTNRDIKLENTLLTGGACPTIKVRQLN